MEETKLDTENKYNLTLPQLQAFNDFALNTLFMMADQDRTQNYRAKCTYWMCVMEINRREHDIFPESMILRCKGNIIDDGEIIFERNNEYTLYAVDETMLVYNDDMRPYVFNMIDGDDMCIWVRFGKPSSLSSASDISS